MINDILTNFKTFVDGRGFAGRCDEVVTPTIEMLTEEFGGGGMSAMIDVEMGGHAKLVSSMTFNGFDQNLYGHFNIAQGALVPFTVRAVSQDADGTKHGHVIEMRGKVIKLDEGTWVRAGKVPLKIDLSLQYYRRLRDGVVLIECDPVNAVFAINGVDQMAETRALLG